MHDEVTNSFLPVLHWLAILQSVKKFLIQKY